MSLKKLERDRIQVRRLFDATADSFNHSVDQNDLLAAKAAFKNLAEKNEVLKGLNASIMDMLLEDEDTPEVFLETEYDTNELYLKDFLRCEQLYLKYCVDEQFNADAVAVKMEQASISCGSVKELKAKTKLPKLSLQSFDLSPRTWVAFWAQFQRIDEDEDISAEDKFQYLLMTLKEGTKARKTIADYPPSAKNYQSAIEQLKSRYGREEFLIEIYIRDIVNLVLNKKQNLSDLFDQLSTKLKSLEALNVTSDRYASFLIPMVESCLPIEVLKFYERERTLKLKDANLSQSFDPSSAYDRLKELMQFIEAEVRAEERISVVKESFKENSKALENKPPPGQASTPSAMGLTNLNKDISCVFCMEKHGSWECTKAVSMDPDAKFECIKKARLCKKCLKGSHFSKFCRAMLPTCALCKKYHVPANACPSEPSTNKPVLNAQNKSETGHIILKTIVVDLVYGNTVKRVRAFIDDGSHDSYILDQEIAALRLPVKSKEVVNHGLFGGTETGNTLHTRHEFQLRNIMGGALINVSALNTKYICSPIPKINDSKLIIQLSEKGIFLSDIGNGTETIDILLGANCIGEILTGRVEVLPGGVSAIETQLGWSVIGAPMKKAENLVSLCLLNVKNKPNDISAFWELEALGIDDPKTSCSNEKNDFEVLENFNREVRWKEEGLYEVKLPWLFGHPDLPVHRGLAEKRLIAVTTKLRKDKKLHDYDEVFKAWESTGIIEEVDSCDDILDDGHLVHYLPHRPVFRESSTKTKVRPVFDASAKFPGEVSLNECLAVGPNLIQEIPAVLSRFRIGAIGVTADIKQAFLMVGVDSRDRDVMRFLWFKDLNMEERKIYRSTRVLFGINSSPFLLGATINYHLKDARFQTAEYSVVAKKLSESFYVDDCVSSVENESELSDFVRKSKEIMIQGNFELRQWLNTGMEANATEEVQSVLGLSWNVKTDELYSKSPELPQILCKRSVLSFYSKIYNPIGVLCPALIFPKLLLQQLWKEGVNWDEPLDSEKTHKFQSWAASLGDLEKCTIPRRFHFGQSDMRCCTLHVFSDASGQAYGCCIFIRCEANNTVTVQLLAAKARIIPPNGCSIPRAELLAAAMGVRLAVSTLSGLKVNIPTTYWADSRIVLCWITSSIPWKTWVGNRVKEIRSHTRIEDWKYVPGEMNPADLPSRGCNFKVLKASNWHEGPSWLYLSSEHWPSGKISVAQEALVEKKMVCVNVSDVDRFSLSLLQYFSKYASIVKVVGWLLRFRNNIFRNGLESNEKWLSVDEMVEAERCLFRVIQNEWSQEEKEKKSNLSFVLRDNLLCVKTKLLEGDFSDEFKWPVVLPGDHELVKKLIIHEHEMACHAGVTTTLTLIRKRVWILKGRQAVKSLIDKCVKCKRFSAKHPETVSVPLPRDRIMQTSVFKISGVDAAGPLYLKDGSKVWIILFTCAVYRAIDLQLITSLSCQNFIMALRRFVAKRGVQVDTMYSDNGLNFVATASLLKEIEQELVVHKIRWKFNLPTASWHGGFFERMISLVKQLLRKIMGKASLNYEEMLTVLCDCERVVNERPLTYVEHNDTLRPLTPMHFISDLDSNQVAGALDSDVVGSSFLVKRVNYLNTLREQLKKRFKDEYLGLLTCPNKRSRGLIKVGDIVLVEMDNMKRVAWPLAKVVDLRPGKDGVCRMAVVKTQTGLLTRPVQRLFSLEVQVDESVDENVEIVQTQVDESVVDENVETAQDSPWNSNVITTRLGRKVVPPKKMDL